jgi:AcrR family transcriptional regulator
MGASRVRSDPTPEAPGSDRAAAEAPPKAPKAAAKSAARTATGAAARGATRTGARAGARATAGPPAGAPTGAPAAKRVLRSQGKRTMRKLLDAAMVAFDKRGYHATRVNDVVEIAKTSHGTFYLYFSNKEDLLRALVAEASEDSRAVYDAFSVLPAPGGTPQWEDVRGWVQAYSDLWTRYAPLFRVWAELVTVDRELGRTIRRTFSGISYALTVRIGPDSSGHDLDPTTAGLAALAMLDRFHYLREFLGRPVDAEALDTVTTMLYRALFDPNA